MRDAGGWGEDVMARVERLSGEYAAMREAKQLRRRGGSARERQRGRR